MGNKILGIFSNILTYFIHSTSVIAQPSEYFWAWTHQVVLDTDLFCIDTSHLLSLGQCHEMGADTCWPNHSSQLWLAPSFAPSWVSYQYAGTLIQQFINCSVLLLYGWRVQPCYDICDALSVSSMQTFGPIYFQWLEMLVKIVFARG